jgi:hypothetical protein
VLPFGGSASLRSWELENAGYWALEARQYFLSGQIIRSSKFDYRSIGAMHMDSPRVRI